MLELIIALPVWLIVALAVVEFGTLLSNLEALALASRVGALEASETTGLSTNNNDPVPAIVLQAIDQHLQTAGLTGCQVFLEHDLTPGNAVVTLSSQLGGGYTCSPPVGLPYPTEREFVRVSVCAPMTSLAPNLLNTFGFDISGKVVRETSTFRHEQP